MDTITLTAPPALNGDALTAELAAAGITATVALVGDELEVTADAEAEDVEAVVAAHTGAGTAGQVQHAERRRRRQALAQVASTRALTAAEQREAVALLLLV